MLAITYTTPWDSYLIHQEIWTYEPGKVLGTFLKIPFEEYFFFIIQTIIGCLFTSFVLKTMKARTDHVMTLGKRHFVILLSLIALIAVTFFSLNPAPEYRYLYLVTFWALPVLVMQWTLGLSVLKREKGPWLLTVVLLTSYFCAADSFAIFKKIWVFPPHTISGIELFGILPIEEGLFFLATNLMVVQGYILFTTVDFSRFQLVLNRKERS